MNTFLLTWDGTVDGYDPADYAEAVAKTIRGEEVHITRSFGTRHGGAEPGDRVYLLRQGTDRGIVASGYLKTGDVTKGPHWKDPTKTAYWVDVTLEVVLDAADRLPIEQLLAGVEGHSWNSVYSSGQLVHADTAAVLDEKWAVHLKCVGRS